VVATLSLLSFGLFLLLSRVLFRPCSGIQLFPPTFDRNERFIRLWVKSPAVLDQWFCNQRHPSVVRSVILVSGFVHAATGGWQLWLVVPTALFCAGLYAIRDKWSRRLDTADVAWADLMGRVII
jgi:hypothetical protein